MFISAFILGLAGSFHCAGMCSPLLLAATRLRQSVIIDRLLYNIGRILTYSVLGSFAASAGYLLPVSRFQSLFSLLLGIALVILGITGVSGVRVPFVSAILGRISSVLKMLFGKFLQRRSYGATLLLGVLNGLLPCGLSFLAFTSCLILPGPWDGFQFMILFGLGTLPVMIGAASLVHFAANRFQFNISKITTALLLLSGVLLIAQVMFTHVAHAPSVHQGLLDVVLCR
jgi:sulfite exporter TauE/SafE